MIFLKPKNIYQNILQRFINLFFRLKISLKKKLKIQIKNNFFISGEFFKSLSNKKIIVLPTHNIPKKKYLNDYKNKIWIFHNSDEKFDLKKKKSLEYFKPKRCFAQNLTFNNNNYHFLPIGLENNSYYNNGDTNDFKILRKFKYQKKSRVLFGFKNTNPKRLKLRNTLKKFNFADETKGWNSYFYRRILVKYMFVACPEGNGIDTHRFWEALYLKTIPIIEKNKISIFLKKMKLPILILNSWSNLNQFNEKKLRNIYLKKKKTI